MQYVGVYYSPQDNVKVVKKFGVSECRYRGTKDVKKVQAWLQHVLLPVNRAVRLEIVQIGPSFKPLVPSSTSSIP